MEQAKSAEDTIVAPMTTPAKHTTLPWQGSEDLEVIIETLEAEEIPTAAVEALESQEQVPWEGTQAAPSDLIVAGEVQEKPMEGVSVTTKERSMPWQTPVDFEVVIENQKKLEKLLV